MKRWRQLKGQWIMDNPETRATMGTMHRTKTKQNKKHSIEEKMNNTDPTRKPEANPGTCER
jgi:hypothetical protein